MTSSTPILPKKPRVEVGFNPDERALLDLLHAKAQPDATVPLSDTVLLRESGLPPERFFPAKMRLVAAGVISLYISFGGSAFIRLEMPERANPRSKRYVLFVAPLDLMPELAQVIRRFRLEKLQEKAMRPATAASSARRDRCIEKGLTRMGVHRIPAAIPGPIRPPVRAPGSRAGEPVA